MLITAFTVWQEKISPQTYKVLYKSNPLYLGAIPGTLLAILIRRRLLPKYCILPVGKAEVWVCDTLPLNIKLISNVAIY